MARAPFFGHHLGPAGEFSRRLRLSLVPLAVLVVTAAFSVSLGRLVLRELDRLQQPAQQHERIPVLRRDALQEFVRRLEQAPGPPAPPPVSSPSPPAVTPAPVPVP